jgi:hypothetical protein
MLAVSVLVIFAFAVVNVSFAVELIVVLPNIILLPAKNMSFHLCVELPNVYVSLIEGMKEFRTLAVNAVSLFKKGETSLEEIYPILLSR